MTKSSFFSALGTLRSLPLVFLALVTFAARATAFNRPMIDIDEQFYLFVARRWLDGVMPYVEIWDRKPIGLFAVYAIPALFGNGVLAYQIFALLSVIATAAIIYAMARRVTDRAGALIAASAYPLWLNLMDGQGGQSPVFYNLLVALAAWIVMRALRTDLLRPVGLFRSGCWAMLLIGLACQIKYNAAGEGIFFGLAMSWAMSRQVKWPTLLAMMAGWVGIALAPTIVAVASFAAIGELPAFVFANFTSIFLRSSVPTAELLKRLALISGIFAPLILICVPGFIRQAHAGASDAVMRDQRFIIGWLLSAILSLVLFGTYFRHYGLALVGPAALAAALAPAHWRRWRKLAVIILIGAAMIGQVRIAKRNHDAGGWSELHAIVAAMPHPRNCPYVNDGPPILYTMTGWCIPSRFAFPPHLHSEPERLALGIDSARELHRILAARPDYIVMQEPAHYTYNMVNYRIIEDVVKRDYVTVKTFPRGARLLVIRRLRPGLQPLPNSFSPAVAPASWSGSGQ